MGVASLLLSMTLIWHTPEASCEKQLEQRRATAAQRAGSRLRRAAGLHGIGYSLGTHHFSQSFTRLT